MKYTWSINWSKKYFLLSIENIFVSNLMNYFL